MDALLIATVIAELVATIHGATKRESEVRCCNRRSHRHHRACRDIDPGNKCRDDSVRRDAHANCQ